MVRRIILLIGAALTLVVGVAPTHAGAQSGPEPTVTVSPDSDDVTVCVVVEANEEITATMDPADGSGTSLSTTSTADADGLACASFAISALDPEAYVLGVSTVRTGPLFSTNVDLAQPTPTTLGSSDLPTTGSNSSLPMARIGAVLVVAGVIAVLSASKRRSRMTIDA